MNNDDEKVVYFGETDSRNRRLQFGIKKKDRSRHMYAIGKTGMGKSNLLEVLAVQDIQNGEGLCFLDPHGKSADLLLEYVPEHRIKDVVYFAPFDMEYPISFNVMEDVGPQQRYLVASGMMSAFKKIWVDAWSARMEYILGNIMLALLEYPGSTLVAVNRMLTDKDFRKEVVEHITDPSVKSFWVNEYANYTDKFAAEAAPAIQNKVGQFVANPLIRNIIGQAKSSFDIRQIMDDKKILIINLSKGRVGEANANLLGSMLITKIYLAAMSRADLKENELADAPNFNLYVDEFQSFANESFADILSEARKYKLSLCIAHQYIEQMTEEVRAAVFGNVGTMCVFRVGAYDAEVLEKEFAPQFTAEDIVNLQKHQMYLKLMIDGVTSPPFSAAGMPPIPRPEVSYTKQIIDTSRAQYAKPRQQIEDELLAWINTQFGKGGGPSAPSAFGKSSPANPNNPNSPVNKSGASDRMSANGDRGGSGGDRGGDSRSNSGGNRPSGSGSSERVGGSSSYSGQSSTVGSSFSGGQNRNDRGGNRGADSRGGDKSNDRGGQSRPTSNMHSNTQPNASQSPYKAVETTNKDSVVTNALEATERAGGPEKGEPSTIESQSPRNPPTSTQPSVQSSDRPFVPDRPQSQRPQTTPFQRQPQQSQSQSSQQSPRSSEPRRGQDFRSAENVKDMNAREDKFRNAISLGYLKAEQEPKNDQKTPKAENINALRDALLSVMGSTGLDLEKKSDESEGDTQENMNDQQSEGSVSNQGNVSRSNSNTEKNNHQSTRQRDGSYTTENSASKNQKGADVRIDVPKEVPEPGTKDEVSEDELKKLLG